MKDLIFLLLTKKKIRTLNNILSYRFKVQIYKIFTKKSAKSGAEGSRAKRVMMDQEPSKPQRSNCGVSRPTLPLPLPLPQRHRRRHTGQIGRFASHESTQRAWKLWRHAGRSRHVSPIRKLSRHTAQSPAPSDLPLTSSSSSSSAPPPEST